MGRDAGTSTWMPRVACRVVSRRETESLGWAGRLAWRVAGGAWVACAADSRDRVESACGTFRERGEARVYSARRSGNTTNVARVPVRLRRVTRHGTHSRV